MVGIALDHRALDIDGGAVVLPSVRGARQIEAALEKGQALLIGEDVLPGFRCKVSDFFFMPGEAAKPAG